jgi:hypothetical protein
VTVSEPDPDVLITDEDWESYRPPAEWDEPLVLPDLPYALEARALG